METESADNVTPIRPIDGTTIRQYDHKDGGYVLVSANEFAIMSETARADYTLIERLPNALEIAEWKQYQKFHGLWQNIVNRLEETSSGRPSVFTKAGNARQWRYSTHDIANIITWTATASNERVKALEERIAELEKLLGDK